MKVAVERLCARLAATPAEFFVPVASSDRQAPCIEAVVADLFRDRASRPLEPAEVETFRFRGRARHAGIVLVACWLLHDEAFTNTPAEPLLALLGARLAELGKLVHARAFVEDPDRREELVRICLHALGASPEGESAAAAEDRLAGLDSVRRDGLLREARARDAEREKRRLELERLRAQEEDERRKAARTTFED